MIEVNDLILSIESSTLCCSAALSSPGKVWSEVTFNLRSDGGRRLAPVIRDMMNGLSVSFRELSAIGVSCGPGSFTGLRVGMSTAKALACANDLPLYSVNSLLLLAFNASLSGLDICPMLDARKGEVYAAIYKFGGRSFEEKLRPTVISPQQLAEILPGKCVLIGEGALGYRELFESGGDSYRPIAPPSLSLPRASHIASLVHSGMVTESVTDVVSLEPLYIRRPEAEKKWRGKGKKTGST